MFPINIFFIRPPDGYGSMGYFCQCEQLKLTCISNKIGLTKRQMLWMRLASGICGRATFCCRLMCWAVFFYQTERIFCYVFFAFSWPRWFIKDARKGFLPFPLIKTHRLWCIPLTVICICSVRTNFNLSIV